MKEQNDAFSGRVEKYYESKKWNKEKKYRKFNQHDQFNQYRITGFVGFF